MLASLARAHLVLAALVCLLFAAGLRDTPAVALRDAPSSARLLPPDAEDAAALFVHVHDDSGRPVARGSVAIYAIVDGVALKSGQAETDFFGMAIVPGLPPGEAWVLTRSDEHARRSSHMILAPGARFLDVSLAPARRFQVVVVDGSERPIPGAGVELFGADPLSYRASTDARGLADFDGVGDAPYAVEVTAAGWDGKFLPHVEPEDSPLFVRLERLGEIEVVVLDPGGDPVAGAKVMAAGSALWPARSADTDASGRVRISGLPRGFYELRAEHGQLVSGTDGGLMLDRGEQKKLELRLEPGVFVRVRVTDAADESSGGISQADVALVAGGLSSFPLYGRTDDAGRATLGPVLADDGSVSVRAKGFVARNAVALEPGQTEVEVALLRGATVTGEVVDDRGFPVDGVTLEAIGVDLDGMPIAESSSITSFRDDHFAFALPGAVPLIPAGELGVMPIVPDLPLGDGPPVVRRSQRDDDPWVTDRYGRFAVSPVPPGRVRLVARHPSFAEALSEPLTLVPGGEGQLKIVLRRGGTLEGRVLEADRTPAAGARIELSDLGAGIDRITYAADDGTFAFAAVGRDCVLSVGRGREMDDVAMRVELEVPDAERREVELILPERREDVTFRVTDDRGYPLDRVELRVVSLDRDEALRRTLFSDDSGEAVLRSARGLPLRVVLVRPGKAPGASELEIAPGSVDLVMLEPLTAEGQVTGRGGYERLAGASITVFTPTAVRHARSDDEGVFRFADLAAGRFRMLVTKGGYAPRELLVDVAGEVGRPVDLGRVDLDLGGTLRGIVRDATDAPLAGARVAIGRVPTYLPLGALPLGVTSTDPRGRFALTDVPAGEFVVEAYVGGVGRSAIDGVIARAGETTDELEIVLRDDAEAVSRAPLHGAGSLAVTLGETGAGSSRLVHFEHVPPGGEAERAAIEPGDRLLEIDGLPVRSIEDARRRMTGPLAQDFIVTLGRSPNLRWHMRVRRERLRE